MKKKYTRPLIILEDFNANEYVAACWGVGCDTKRANEIERELNNRPLAGHQDHQCGTDSHQHIFTDSDGTPEYMIEDSYGYGNLKCTLYTDDTYSTELDIASVKIGDTIYWITYGTKYGTNIYHHVGTVKETYPGNSNHS